MKEAKLNVKQDAVKELMPAYFAVAFVWFTTHFGGGFASGAQVVSYYTKFGWFGVFTPIISQAVEAFVFYYAWKYAVEHKLFDYRSWAESFYKPVDKVMANVFEIVYNLILLTATAVAFATGGATLSTVFGTNYLLNTVLIAGAIFLLTIFGASVVRKAASYIAIFIIVGILIVYIPNVFANWSNITQNIAGLKSGALPSDATIWDAIWRSLVYAGFQSCCLGAYLAHSHALKDVKTVKKAASWGFVINVIILMIATLGIMGFYQEGILTESVPSLFVVMNGVGSNWMVPLISVLILVGAVSTGVNLIFGNTQRIVTWWGRKESPERSKEMETKRSIIASIVYVIITWSIAQFGLLPLIAKGYGTMGYVAIPVIILPLLIKGIRGWKVEAK